ncbi:hypothetical protein C8J47_1241 [Sphingomonas sp. PP-F2F-G114-C0414]|uniref:hypothetical protein n=1 Tax=Sphingomonas sp. PP-F2F-G114-C0414 TaxID=2135662 RepID=UPI000F1BE52B|nr:hypothetical protein [Sphingomonas sp. PP-F2F-G114-C0414]RMB35723.1 hypothetical protein C8J47_1241 [Sphingomonas sp. PP-F2F-G114-C0414]
MPLHPTDTMAGETLPSPGILFTRIEVTVAGLAQSEKGHALFKASAVASRPDTAALYQRPIWRHGR